MQFAGCRLALTRGDGVGGTGWSDEMHIDEERPKRRHSVSILFSILLIFVFFFIMLCGCAAWHGSQDPFPGKWSSLTDLDEYNGLYVYDFGRDGAIYRLDYVNFYNEEFWKAPLHAKQGGLAVARTLVGRYEIADSIVWLTAGLDSEAYEFAYDGKTVTLRPACSAEAKARQPVTYVRERRARELGLYK